MICTARVDKINEEEKFVTVHLYGDGELLGTGTLDYLPGMYTGQEVPLSGVELLERMNHE